MSTEAEPPSTSQTTSLSPSELQRYARHLTLPEVGIEGQERLAAGRVLCIGAGGLGSPAALYLAAAGVGTIGIVDPDIVDASNLQRQILHGESDLGRSKLASAVDRLAEINPHVTIKTFDAFFRSDNAMAIASNFDIILDGTDNFQTRYLSNDVSVFLKKPNVYGSIFRFEGQCSVFAPHLGGPCYRCMFPEPPDPGSVPSCAEGGVLGVLPGIIGSMQALEAIKLILGKGESLVGRLVHFDALKFRIREFAIRRDPECPVCGDHPTIHEPIDYEAFCGLSENKTPPAPASTATPETSVRELSARLERKDPFLLLDVREPFEYGICNIQNSKLIPLGELGSRLDELREDEEIVIYCKAGARSENALHFLQSRGFRKVSHVPGGIDAWAEQIDSSMNRY